MRNVVDIIKNTNINQTYSSINSSISQPYQREINDYAILKLDFSLDFNNDNIKPACLPNATTDIGLDFINNHCFASGWGTLKSG